MKLAPLAIVAHSLGGNISLRYAGLYPQNVSRLVVIEGMTSMPNGPVEAQPEKVVPRMVDWLDEQRRLSARLPKRYATIDEAFQRMHAENKHLSEAQARHLTYHGVSQNEDGTFSWKFDNYVRAFPPNDLAPAELAHLWLSLIHISAQDWAMSQGMLTLGDAKATIAHYEAAAGFSIDQSSLDFYRVWEVWKAVPTLNNGLRSFLDGTDKSVARLNLGYGRVKLFEQLLGMMIGKPIDEAAAIVERWRKSPYRPENAAA